MQPSTSQSGRSDRSLLVLMDSNRRYINKDMLWKSSNISVYNTLTGAVNVIPSLTKHPQAILVHAGVNDIEHFKPEEFVETVTSLVTECKQNLPNTELILSEIIPRMDGLDRDVIATNRMIHEMLQDEEVIIIKHHSLRNRHFYSDNKYNWHSEAGRKSKIWNTKSIWNPKIQFGKFTELEPGRAWLEQLGV